MQKRIYSLGLWVALFPMLAAAASFDCTQAKSPIEKMICNNKSLSDLDDQLDDTYRNTLKVAAAPGEVKTSQTQWLKGSRAACTSVACLEQAYNARIANLKTVKPFTWKSFEDTKLGIKFNYPSNETPKVDYTQLTVQMLGFDMQPSDYIIEFHVYPGNFEAANAKAQVFDKQGNDWVNDNGPDGLADPVTAAAFSAQNWHGFKSTIACNLEDENGTHSGAGDCFWALFSDGNNSIVSDTQGILGNDATTLQMIKSITFLPAVTKS